MQKTETRRNGERNIKKNGVTEKKAKENLKNKHTHTEKKKKKTLELFPGKTNKIPHLRNVKSLLLKCHI